MKLIINAILGPSSSMLRAGGKPSPNLFRKELEYDTSDHDNTCLLNSGFFFIKTNHYSIQIGMDAYQHFTLTDENEHTGKALGQVADISKAVFDALERDGWECILTERDRSYYNIPSDIELPIKAR